MSKKLLIKTRQGYLAFSVVVLLLAAPAFYYLSQWLHLYQTDRVLKLHKDAFSRLDLDTFSDEDLVVWNKYNHDVKILRGGGLSQDTVFTTTIFDSLSGHHELYREMRAPLTINNKPYTYIERNHLAEMQDMVYGVAFIFIVVIGILLIGITLFSNRWAKKLWTPFYDTLKQIQSFDIDKSREPRFTPTGTEEFDYLNNSIGKLIEKNTAIYRNQKEFIENAAHELQTPLTVIQTKLESLFQSAEQSEHQAVLIESINGDLSRLHRLSKNLMLLSSMENEAYANKQAFPVSQYLTKNIEFFTTQAESKDIEIRLEIREDHIVHANPALLEILVNNLFANAIRHTAAGGVIITELSGIELKFSNTGTASLDQSRLYNRFSKSESAGKGNGLGLSIVKKIIEINNWEIEYGFLGEMHHFTVKFR